MNKEEGAGFRAFYHSGGAEETVALGRALAACLEGGDTLLLEGGLGMGKTWFTHGLAEGLEVLGPVQSPTFTLMILHPPKEEGGLSLLHFDAYRLSGPDDWYELGFDEHPGPREVSVIEWPERVAEALPERVKRVTLAPSEGDFNAREITISFPDPLADAQIERLKAAGVEVLC